MIKKKNFATEPIENHKTAAWADAENTSKITKINEPRETQVKNAKEYVDENEK